jgi:prepilin-type N-terminal cleavage/methylation domain-containing protein
MTFATSHSDSRARRRGFTLVELLVVIVIIVVLAGILLPTLIRAYAHADKTKAAADLQSVSVALEAFKSDFGDYPRIDRALNASGSSMGATLLCRSLIGPSGVTAATPDPRSSTYSATATYSPGDYINDGTNSYVCIASGAAAGTALTNLTYFTPYTMYDGKDGPGFKNRIPGPSYGPYLNVERFKVTGSVITDKNDQPILYYPTANKGANISAAPSATVGGYVGVAPATGRPYPLYCSTDNLGYMSNINLCGLLGDFSCDGKIDSVGTSTIGPETAIGTFPFLLVAAGPDGAFGPSGLTASMNAGQVNWAKNKDAVRQCDDVTNFPR